MRSHSLAPIFAEPPPLPIAPVPHAPMPNRQSPLRCCSSSTPSSHTPSALLQDRWLMAGGHRRRDVAVAPAFAAATGAVASAFAAAAGGWRGRHSLPHFVMLPCAAHASASSLFYISRDKLSNNKQLLMIWFRLRLRV